MSYVYIVGCSAVLLYTIVGCGTYREIKKKLPLVFPNYVQCNVVGVIDGDEFDRQFPNVQIERIKLIGVKIPASIKQRARRFARSELNRGLPVTGQARTGSTHD